MSATQAGFRLRTVLWCSGNGADASSYRPKRDDSQWWGRRDALTRCVAATARGELVLLFDGDLSRMEMKVCDNENRKFIPMEKNIIALWKRAAQKPNVTVKTACGTLKCRLVSSREAGSSDLTTSNTKDLSKKDILKLLQKNCNLEFLREHRLNSSPDVLLRKTNRATLAKAWQAWNNSSSSSKKRKREDNIPKFERIYQDILAPTSTHRSVVGTLHENYPELPCFGTHLHQDGDTDGSSDESRLPIYLTVILGAVRDMSDEEHTALSNVCQKAKIPQVSMRLGTTPEFTSKILSLVSFHSNQGLLERAVERMILNSEYRDCGSHMQCSPSDAVTDTPPPRPSMLHVFCTVPVLSSKLSISLEDRDENHWTLVRLVVSALWRSKFMTSDSSTTCSLTLTFEDGAIITLQQKSFVAELANQHQAAPSEYQILTALRARLDKSKGASLKDSIRQLIPQDRSACRVCALDANDDLNSSLVERFYSARPSSPATSAICAFLLLGMGTSTALRDTFLTLDIPLISIPTPSHIDRHAMTIVAVQHMLNQRRLYIDDEEQKKAIDSRQLEHKMKKKMKKMKRKKQSD